MNITTATPAEIDTELAAIWTRYYAATDTVTELAVRMNKAIRVNAALAAGDGNFRFYSVTTDAELAAMKDRLTAAIDTADAILAETNPLDAEFTRRGGWTRAYLVKNNGGHIHSSMACNTCYDTTRFGWLTQVSDHTETEIVELAGEGACSVCYPTAPRTGRNQLELPADKEAREARQAEKQARDEAKAAKAITNPDGSALRGRHGVLATVVTARNTVVDNRVYVEGYGYRTDHTDENNRIYAALAHKTGQSIEQVIAEIDAKVAPKVRKAQRARA